MPDSCPRKVSGGCPRGSTHIGYLWSRGHFLTRSGWCPFWRQRGCGRGQDYICATFLGGGAWGWGWIGRSSGGRFRHFRLSCFRTHTFGKFTNPRKRFCGGIEIDGSGTGERLDKSRIRPARERSHGKNRHPQTLACPNESWVFDVVRFGDDIDNCARLARAMSIGIPVLVLSDTEKVLARLDPDLFPLLRRRKLGDRTQDGGSFCSVKGRRIDHNGVSIWLSIQANRCRNYGDGEPTYKPNPNASSREHGKRSTLDGGLSFRDSLIQQPLRLQISRPSLQQRPIRIHLADGEPVWRG